MGVNGFLLEELESGFSLSPVEPIASIPTVKASNVSPRAGDAVGVGVEQTGRSQTLATVPEGVQFVLPLYVEYWQDWIPFPAPQTASAGWQTPQFINGPALHKLLATLMFVLAVEQVLPLQALTETVQVAELFGAVHVFVFPLVFALATKPQVELQLYVVVELVFAQFAVRLEEFPTVTLEGFAVRLEQVIGDGLEVVQQTPVEQ